MEHLKPRGTPILGALAAFLRRIAGRAVTADPHVPAPAAQAPAPRPDDHLMTVSEHLEDGTIHLLESLPPDLRLVTLRGEFPRVLNKLAHVWDDPAEFLPTMESLLLDDRVARQGFPFDALKELTEIRDYYTSQVARLPGAVEAGDGQDPRRA